RGSGWGYGPCVGVLSIIVVILSCCGVISSSGACPASCTCLPILFQKNQELTMTMLGDVLGTAVPVAKNRICSLWRRRGGRSGSDPSSPGISVTRSLIPVLICPAVG